MRKEINPDKLKALDKAMLGIDKQFGKGTVMRLGDAPKVDIDVIPSGSFLLNKALGIGGYPRGRIIEIYGPESSGKTTLTLHAVAEAQKNGGLCAFVDAEHALDPTYAAALGVDIDNLVISQPDTGEQGLDVVEALVKSGAIDLIVVDSVAALVPKAEIEGEMGQAFIGIHARLMSQALRKLAGIVHQTNTTVIFINQLREKVGVMFGCLHADTLVNFTDGRSLPIREVVENQIEGCVWSYNDETKEFEEKQIIDWHYNGNIENREDYIHIQTEGIEHNGGRFGITVTPDHEVMTDKGWKKAKDISFDDRLLSKYHETVNGTYKDFLYGTLVGDSHIKIRSKNTASINFQDVNTEYLNWKINKLDKFIEFNQVKENRFESGYTYELSKIKKSLGERNPLELFKNYSDMGLAVWYMDDGNFDTKDSHYRVSISIKRFKNNSEILNQVVEEFKKIGIETKYDKYGSITFTKENTIKLFERIHKFIPECMQYKLGEEFRGKYEEFELTNNKVIKDDYVEIKEIRQASQRQFKQKGKYDITVEDNHNYLVGGNTNGVIVHNSPEVTTGGRALKFYSSIRIDIRRKDQIKKGDDVIGNRTKVKVVKNKVAPPFKEVEFDIMYGKGIDTPGELVDIAVIEDIIKKAGAWFSYGEKRWQGRENTKTAMLEDPEMYEEISQKILKLNDTGAVVTGDAVEDEEQGIEPFDI